MSDFIDNTERFINSSGLFGRRRTLLTGRGATALILLFKELGNPNSRIFLPAIGCPSLLASALIVGKKPVTIDVNHNLNINPDAVENAVQPGDIVLAVHSFGIPCDIIRLEKICKNHNAILIEDAAQAIGGKVDGRPVGTFGHASVLSFASGKILPTIGGGAILVDNGDLYDKLHERITELPARPDKISEKSHKLRDILTDAFNKARQGYPEEASIWGQIFNDYRDNYKFSIAESEAEAIPDAIRNLDEIAKKHRDGVEIYNRYLNLPGVRRLDYPAACSPWRYTFMLPEFDGARVQSVTDEIRSRGINASNLYLPLHWLAPDMVGTTGCPVADEAGVRVINMWLEDGMPPSDAPIVAGILKKWTQ